MNKFTGYITNFYKRSLYLIYYLKQLDRKKFRKFYQYVRLNKGYSSLYLLADILKSVYKDNIGLMDYFIFRFYDKSDEERSEWAGTGFIYEYHLKMNPKRTRNLLADKIDFYEAYAPFVKHATCTIGDLIQNNDKAEKVIQNPSGKIVLKDALGQCGWAVEVINSNDFDRERLIKYMSERKFNLAEEYIHQHPDLAKLSASGLNTVRVITQLNKKNEVEILGARLRISVNNHVDNLASGNIAVPVDIETGKVIGVGVYSDITKEDVAFHPVSGVAFMGFQIPFWKETLELTRRAALFHSENRSIGWDVAISESGPEFIEGNHNWCKILWQLPVKKGLKKTLYQYM
jgi:hypothetical protein